MLKIKQAAELLSITPRTEFHGDETRKAVTLKLKLSSVPLPIVEDAFVGQLALFYDANDALAITDLKPLEATRDVENVDVELAGVTWRRMRVSKVKIKPQPRGRFVDVTLSVGGVIEGGLDAVHEHLLDSLTVSMTEREPELAKLEGGLAPAEEAPQARAH